MESSNCDTIKMEVEEASLDVMMPGYCDSAGVFHPYTSSQAYEKYMLYRDVLKGNKNVTLQYEQSKKRKQIDASA